MQEYESEGLKPSLAASLWPLEKGILEQGGVPIVPDSTSVHFPRPQNLHQTLLLALRAYRSSCRGCLGFRV